MTYQDLIILCLHFLSDRKGGCLFEELVAECFQRFPDRFSFESHPEWPDARKLDRALRGLRGRGYIKGDPQTSFSLTKSGLKKGRELSEIFRQEKLF